MTGLPGGAGALLPERGVARLAVLGITADHHQTETLLGEAVERGLVLVRSQAVTGLPGRTAALLPDRVEARSASLTIAVHIGQTEALTHQAVEGRLVGIAVDPVSRLPCGAVALLEDRRDPRGEARQGHRLPAGSP